MDSLLSTEVRKLRKKLRQIETLEHLQRDLTESEARKVSCKREIRSELTQLLSRSATWGDGSSTPDSLGSQQTPEEPPTEAGDMKRSLPGEEGPRPGDAAASGDIPERPQVPVKQPKITLAAAEPGADNQKEPGQQKDPLLAQKRAWRDVRFDVRRLVGHADLITAVLFHGSLVISASRDTTVKVWHVPTGTEEKNLAGHHGAVTCLTVIPDTHAARITADLGCDAQEQFVASGSTDSSIILWALQKGAAVQNIYTFCGVSALSCLQESGLLVSGSEAGKVEVWDPLSRETRQSERAHEDTVTALQERSGYLYSGSADGGVKVWQLRAGAQLCLVYASEHVSSRIRSVRCLAVAADRLYFGNDGTNVKVLSWRTGTLGRLTNHLSESGFVDAMHVTNDGLLISTGFNIDVGQGYLNVRSLDTGGYLGTLACSDAPRLLCLDAWQTPSGLHRWVTGGKELLVWEQLPVNSADRSSLKMTYWSAFEKKAAESGSEGADSDISEDEEEEEEDRYHGGKCRERPQDESKGWSWCSLL